MDRMGVFGEWENVGDWNQKQRTWVQGDNISRLCYARRQ
jgi:hypothetical protein